MKTERGAARQIALPYTARVRMAPLLTICVFAVCLSLLALALRPLGVGRAVVTILVLSVWLGVAALLIWLGSYRIDVLPDRLCYARLGGQREIAYADLREVTLEQVGPLTGQTDHPPSLLRLRGASDEQTLLIATRPFHDGDLAILLDAVEQLAPRVRLDDSVRALRASHRA
jgi:hypothetical protein